MLKNKKALVTGGTRGIGKAIVFDLAANGCNVIFTYHSSEEAAKSIEKESEKFGIKIIGFKADASKFIDTEKSIQFILEKLGNLDILVNNAGITKDNLILRMTEEDFDTVISANLKSVFNYSKLAIKPMMKQRYGRIINISSVVALIGNPGQANYVASKAGVIGLTKSLAREFASRNITVNAVAPGYVSTDMTKELNEVQKEAIVSQIPLKRIAEPVDIAKVVTFLASPSADYITGQVIAVDGGMTM
ncbi:MAG: 3-oxoacyl-[acyl-carrier-protein] reductase [Ignavibacteriales bacterium CG_4_9_14_3_um_filter_30_11]|nr:MAG: 3-oxoacyl-[acyl-carrier-protein] reductase [Ignavibacteriales bacterium CG12_big_fil_rev_8_21_14_0_65_30_8]PJA98791.1 MAG: 3-oxoacyl-[acyl-carrier-protein] reductase [Ignavibacteriales bacterium CG_4_9_14_3_um_filter_30_11]